VYPVCTQEISLGVKKALHLCKALVDMVGRERLGRSTIGLKVQRGAQNGLYIILDKPQQKRVEIRVENKYN